MPYQTCEFKLQKNVDDSSRSRFRAGDTGLGNCRPKLLGKSYKTCSLYEDHDTVAVLNETHVALDCDAVEYERRVPGLLSFS